MIYRSKSPLRLGLAGGGTDVSPYSDEFGGAILNATINMFAYATIEPLETGEVIFEALDIGIMENYTSESEISEAREMALHYGVYKRIKKKFPDRNLSFRLSTSVDAPPGSGLGSSSTLVVAIIGAFVEWLKLPLGEYDIAQLAFDIERVDLSMAGGKQDQYAATFGGINFMEFFSNKVIVNPLRVKPEVLNELELNLLLYFTNKSRNSSDIIKIQMANVEGKKEKPVEAMHKIKELAIEMKEAILTGQLNAIGEILDKGWQHKKEMAAGITNTQIDEIYAIAKENGATGGKVSGAGGGGFMILYCPGTSRHRVQKALENTDGEFRSFQFTKYGMSSWRI